MAIWGKIPGVVKALIKGGSSPVLSIPTSLMGIGRTILRGVAHAVGKAGVSLTEFSSRLEKAGMLEVSHVYGQDAKELVQKASLTGAIRNWSDTRRLDKDLMIETVLPGDRKYRVYYEVTLFDPETGNTWAEQKSFYTENLETFETYRWTIMDNSETQMYDNTFEVQGISFISVFHNRERDY